MSAFEFKSDFCPFDDESIENPFATKINADATDHVGMLKHFVDIAVKPAARDLVSAFESSYSRENIKHPLHLAASHGCVKEMAAILSLLPSYVDAVDEDGRTAMHIIVENALEKISLEVRKYMLDILFGHGSSALHIADKQGRTPLHLASLHADEATIEYLIKRDRASIGYNAHRFQRDRQGFTPLHLAIVASRHAIVRVFLELAEPPLGSCNNMLRSEFFSACCIDLQMAELLWISPASHQYIDVCDCDCTSPLTATLNKGLVDVAAFLLKNGALFNKMNALTEEGRATLGKAVRLIKEEGGSIDNEHINQVLLTQ